MSVLHDYALPIGLSVGAVGIFFILRNVFQSDVVKLEKAVIQKDKKINQLKEELKIANEKNKVLEEASHENIINENIINENIINENIINGNTINEDIKMFESITKDITNNDHANTYTVIFEMFSSSINAMHFVLDKYLNLAVRTNSTNIFICTLMLICLFAGPVLYHTYVKRMNTLSENNMKEKALSDNVIRYRHIINNEHLDKITRNTLNKYDQVNELHEKLTLRRIPLMFYFLMKFCDKKKYKKC